MRQSSPPGDYECVFLIDLLFVTRIRGFKHGSLTYESSDAASTDAGLEVALQLLLDGASGVEALSQKNDGVYKEEGGDAVDDVLKDLDPGHRQTYLRVFSQLCVAKTA